MHPGVIFTLLLALSAMLAYRALKRPEARLAYGLGGAVSFLLINYWTVSYMRADLLLWGLGYYMAFAAIHTVFPVAVSKTSSDDEAAARRFCGADPGARIDSDRDGVLRFVIDLLMACYFVVRAFGRCFVVACGFATRHGGNDSPHH